jgi:TetR/AcrR family transcriptional regulator, mexJK operon transcriptional repressor
VPKSLKNAQKKQNIIAQAALELFLQQGYAATSMDSVAALAGVTKQTVYRYYPSKGELFTAAMEKVRSNEPPLYQFGERPPEHELTDFARSLLAFHLSPGAIGVYKIMLREGAKEEGLLKPFMQAGPARVNALLTRFLQHHYPALEDVAFYAQMFISMVLVPRNQLIIQGKRRFSRSKREAHVKKVVRLFLNGLQR